MASHRIAVVAGDGIGKEVVPEGLRVLEATARKFDIGLSFDRFDWSADNYDKIGAWMPPPAGSNHGTDSPPPQATRSARTHAFSGST